VEGIAGAYEAGLEISFAGLFAGEARCRISLPAYPFQRRHHWIETRPNSSSEG
jgi:acyl transferase domain-containing protein